MLAAVAATCLTILATSLQYVPRLQQLRLSRNNGVAVLVTSPQCMPQSPDFQARKPLTCEGVPFPSPKEVPLSRPDAGAGFRASHIAASAVYASPKDSADLSVDFHLPVLNPHAVAVTIVSAMLAQPNHAEVAERGCRAVRSMASPYVLQRAIDARALDAVLDALRAIDARAPDAVLDVLRAHGGSMEEGR
jgi:hypothetical protein